MISTDEHLILKFNPYISEAKQISGKLEEAFKDMSKKLIGATPENNKAHFVRVFRKILDENSEQKVNTFKSITKMIEYFHKLIKENRVFFIRKFMTFFLKLTNFFKIIRRISSRI